MALIIIRNRTSGVPAVINPHADVDCHLELARAKRLSITHIFRAHLHADLVSRAHELMLNLLHISRGVFEVMLAVPVLVGLFVFKRASLR